MPAYEEKLVIGEQEKDDEVKASQGLFYVGMPEDEQLSLFNQMADKIKTLEKGTYTKDLRSIEDEFRNKNSVDPGHGHFIENLFSGGATDGKVATAQADLETVAWETIPGPETIADTFTAGQAITAGEAVALVGAKTADVTFDEANYTDPEPFGNGAGNEFIAQSFLATASYWWGADCYLLKVGTPTDNITAYLYDSSNTLIATSDVVAGSSLSTSIGWISFWFQDMPLLTAATYKLVLNRSGANDASNYYKWGSDKTIPDPPHNAGYASGQMLRAATVATLAVFGTSPYSDAIFKTYKASTTSVVLRKTKATSPILNSNFIGFAPSNIADAASGSVTRFGAVTGLSSLTAGRVYYLSDTAGAISLTQGTQSVPVLASDSTTSGVILIIPPPLVTGLLLLARTVSGSPILLANATTYYSTPFSNTAANTTESTGYAVTRAGTIKNLYLYSASNNCITTVRKNAVDTTLHVHHSSATPLQSDLVNSFTVVAGDLITVSHVVSGGTSLDPVSYSMEFQTL